MKKNRFIHEWDSNSLMKTFRIMRITVFLLLASILQTFANDAYSQKTRLSLDFLETKLVDVLDEIENKTEFYFLFNEKLIDTDRKVNMSVKDEKIDEILDQLFAGTDVVYTITDRKIILAPSFLSENEQQQKSISGTVTDESGQPLPGVTVVLKGTTQGTVTNVDGNYSLPNIPDNATLVFSFVGMLTKEVVVGNQTVINVALQEDIIRLEEMVVVGYGIQKKANLTGSVTMLKTEDLTKRQVVSASNLLQGLSPGVTVQQQSGRPGADGASIRIRGLSSIYAGQAPLILVDGVVSSFEGLDPNSIESISILKDAASTSIYGSRAANGVILVQTKRGKEKGIKMSYNTYVMKQIATAIPARTTAIEHMELSNIAEQNRTGNPIAMLFPKELIDKYKNNPPNNLDIIDTDWLGLLLTNNGIMNNHNVSLSSGGDFSNVYASLAYTNQQGLIPNNSFERYDFRLNPDFKIRNNLTLSGVINYNYRTTVNPSTGNPEFIIRQAIGLPAIGGGKYGPGIYGTAGQTNLRNPLAMVEAAGTSVSKVSSLLTKATLNYQPVEGLDIEAYWAREQWMPHGKTFVKLVDIYVPNVATQNYDKIGQWPSTTSLGESYSTSTRTTYLAQATYSFKINNHNFKLLGGAQTEEFTYSGISASRTGFLNPNQPYLNLGAANSTNTGSGYETALAGFFGRLNYNFNDKYLLEFNTRYDGSSRFSQKLDLQWGIFPSASAGWVFSNESFFQNLGHIISFGKLRGSWGILGNESLPEVYPFAVNFVATNYYTDNITTLGYWLTGAPNPNITWEKSKQTNVGFDLNFIQKINVIFDYYVRTLEDMLLLLPIPSYIGLSAPFVNVGGMENRGWEFSLNYRTNIKDLKIDVTGMLSDVKNEVTDIGGLPYLDGGSVRTYEGEALWSYYGYKSLGYFKSKEDIQGSPVQFGIPWNNAVNVGPKPGDVKYADINGPDGVPDGKVDANDRALIGSSFPRYEYSLNLNLNYKNFDLSIFGQGVGKRDNYLSGTGAIPFFSADYSASLLRIHKDYWTENKQDALFPRLLPAGLGGNNFVTSTHWIKSASYFRIKNVNLAYNLPDNWFRAIGANGVKVYVSGQNLFTFTKAWDGFDPEINNANAEFYPLLTTYSAGLSLNF